MIVVVVVVDVAAVAVDSAASMVAADIAVYYSKMEEYKDHSMDRPAFSC